MERLVRGLDFKRLQAAPSPKPFKTWSGTEGGRVQTAVNSCTWSQDRKTSPFGIAIYMGITAALIVVIEMQASSMSITPELYLPTATSLLSGAFLALLAIVQQPSSSQPILIRKAGEAPASELKWAGI